MSLKYIATALENAIDDCVSMPVNGRVLQIAGTVVRAVLPRATIGELCLLKNAHNDVGTPAEVIGIEKKEVLLAPIGDMSGMSTSTQVVATGKKLNVAVGDDLLGCVLDGVGNVVSTGGRQTVNLPYSYPIICDAPDPLSRDKIDRPLPLGIRVLDGLATCGVGQRIGIFAGAGVGKSTFMSMLVAHAEVDINVVALIGERGREVREFIEDSLGENIKKTVVIIATSERPAIERLKAAYVATAVAEYFRDQGKSVLLMMDSLTRFARAQREIGLSVGEAPARRGFPPSVFAELPKLVERAGRSDKGSITAFYTVLVEGDDMADPVADEIRSLLDGHLVLSRKLAAESHYPAVDILDSLSRVMSVLVSAEQRQAAAKVNELLAKYRELEFLIRVGEYKKGADPIADEAVAKIDAINAFLKQQTDEFSHYQDTVQRLLSLV